MRRPQLRLTIRSLMIGLAISTILAAAGAQGYRLARVRSTRLERLAMYRQELADAEKELADWDDVMADLAKIPLEERNAQITEGMDIRARLIALKCVMPFWQHLADHPWESCPREFDQILY